MSTNLAVTVVVAACIAQSSEGISASSEAVSNVAALEECFAHAKVAAEVGDEQDGIQRVEQAQNTCDTVKLNEMSAADQSRFQQVQKDLTALGHIHTELDAVRALAQRGESEAALRKLDGIRSNLTEEGYAIEKVRISQILKAPIMLHSYRDLHKLAIIGMRTDKIYSVPAALRADGRHICEAVVGNPPFCVGSETVLPVELDISYEQASALYDAHGAVRCLSVKMNRGGILQVVDVHPFPC